MRYITKTDVNEAGRYPHADWPSETESSSCEWRRDMVQTRPEQHPGGRKGCGLKNKGLDVICSRFMKPKVLIYYTR